MVWAAVDTAAHGGLAIEPLFVGLPFDDVQLRKQTRVKWDDYCTIVERIAEACGGMTELEDLVESSYHLVLPELRTLVGAVLSPAHYARFVFDVLDPLMFPALAFRFEELARDHLRIHITNRPGVRHCEAFYRGSIGATRGMTRMLGLPPARVEAIITPEGSTYDVVLPPAPTWAERGRRATSAVRRLAVRLILGATSDGTQLSAEIGEPELSPVAHAVAALQLTPRQGQVLERIAEGLTNKEIAQQLGTAENTIELHVTRILRKADASSRSQLLAKLWTRAWGFPH